MPKGKSKPRQPTDNTATELAQHGGERDEDDEEAELEPGLAKALDLMTNKLMTAINDKLEPLAKTVLSHTTELKRANDRLDEAEARVLQLETANEPHAERIVALERQVESLHDHIDELENRGGGKISASSTCPRILRGEMLWTFLKTGYRIFSAWILKGAE